VPDVQGWGGGGGGATHNSLASKELLTTAAIRLHMDSCGSVGELLGRHDITTSPLDKLYRSGVNLSSNTMSPSVFKVGSIDGPKH
jgi:hypothetical protein